MILCVTLNPCLDKTLTVPAWSPGDNVRGMAVEEVVGGKGNNVARALKRLGRDPTVLTFLGGAVGKHCEALLRDADRIPALVVRTASPTRVILTVRSTGATPDTAFFDPDPGITGDEALALLTWTDSVLSEGSLSAVTLSGSSPCPATHDLFARVIRSCRNAGVPVLLDTYGPALSAVSERWPDAIHVNRKEAAQHLNERSPSDGRLLGLLREWSAAGVSLAIITDGPGSVLASLDGQLVRATPPEIEEVNPVGSGDCLVAGLADAWLRGESVEACLRFALAAGAANASTWTAGAITRERVESLAPRVSIEPA